MSTVTTLHEKSTFTFHRVKRCARQLPRETYNHSQIPFLPESYPQHRDNLSGIDVAVRAKILKRHLEDAFGTNRFSVATMRRKDYSIISVQHDLVKPEMITGIVQMYEMMPQKSALIRLHLVHVSNVRVHRKKRHRCS